MATSPTLHLCLLQTDITWEDPPANIELADKLIASAPPAHLYILPEMWATGFTMQPAEAVAKDQGQALDWMKTTAVKHNAAICGSLSVEDAGRFYNRFYCSFPEGRIASYDKKHLFTYSGEDLQYTPGTGKIVFELHGWRVRPIICYDL